MTSTVLFITDPLCSWCWGTLPEIERTRQAMEGEARFDLLMAGLQVGDKRGLATYNMTQLAKLWREVHAITGQTFSGIIPERFVYHSEIACRAVEIARDRLSAPPWDFFHSLQSAFYVDGLDINSTTVLAPLLDLPEKETAALLREPRYITAARENFQRAKDLSANALPGIYLDDKLVCGGYVTADQLTADLRQWLR